MRHILLLILAVATLMAADATGKWTGAMIVPGDSSGDPHPAYLILKQDGAKLTGSAGPDAAEQYPITNGKIENGAITFEVPTPDAMLKFALKQDGEEIKGDITKQNAGESVTAKLTAKREK